MNMGRISRLLILFMSFSLSGQATTEQGDKKKGRYEVSYSRSDMGGGGYITGIVQDYHNPDILYARSDVAGVFKTTNGGKSWDAINSGMNLVSDHYCHSLAINPFDSKMLLRASGDVRSFKFTGRIHKSTDGGNHWKLVKDKLDFWGNGDTRMLGELIAFDPLQKGRIAVGTYSKGVYISNDNGEHWSYSGLKDERISFVRFYKGKMYVGTIPDSALPGKTGYSKEQIAKDMLLTQDRLRHKTFGCIYVSEDYGKHWNVLYQIENVGILEMEIMNEGNVLLFISDKGVYRSVDGGKHFYWIEDEYLPRTSRYQTVTVSPVDSNVVYTAEKYARSAALPIYKSDDFGASWYLLSPGLKKENLQEFPKFHGKEPKMLGGSISHILPDCRDRNRLYFSNFWGVTQTSDGGHNYTGNHFRGLETLCMEQLTRHPYCKEYLFAGICDHPLYYSDDDGVSYRSVDLLDGPARIVCCSKWSPFVYWVAQRKGEYCDFLYSTDLGKTGKRKRIGTKDNFVQCLIEDNTCKGKLWMMMEGETEGEFGKGGGAGIYMSANNGDTWDKVHTPFFDQAKTIPVFKEYIDNNFMAIVTYQTKNGCGTNKLMAMDCQRNSLYVGEWCTGLFRTDNEGMHWEDISHGLPFDKKNNSILNFVYPHPFMEGRLYAGFWNGGLWESCDFGKHWKKVTMPGMKNINATAMHIDCNREGECVTVLACANHLLANHPTAIFIREGDEKWTNIYDPALGAMKWVDIVIDAKEQSIHLATVGSGIIRLKYK